MRKYFSVFLLLTAAACSTYVEVEDVREYKCGDQIVKVEALDDDSMIININGINNVLVKSSGDSDRYVNLATQVSFTQNGDTPYLHIKDRQYPHCVEIVR